MCWQNSEVVLKQFINAKTWRFQKALRESSTYNLKTCTLYHDQATIIERKSDGNYCVTRSMLHFSYTKIAFKSDFRLCTVGQHLLKYPFPAYASTAFPVQHSDRLWRVGLVTGSFQDLPIVEMIEALCTRTGFSPVHDPACLVGYVHLTKEKT